MKNTKSRKIVEDTGTISAAKSFYATRNENAFDNNLTQAFQFKRIQKQLMSKLNVGDTVIGLMQEGTYRFHEIALGKIIFKNKYFITVEYELRKRDGKPIYNTCGKIQTDRYTYDYSDMLKNYVCRYDGKISDELIKALGSASENLQQLSNTLGKDPELSTRFVKSIIKLVKPDVYPFVA